MTTKLESLKNELVAWGKYCRGSESHLAGNVRSPSGTIEEIGRVGVFASGTGFLDQRSETMRLPEWIESIDRRVNQLTPKMRVIVRTEFVQTGMMPIKARKIGLSAAAFKRMLAIALIQMLSE